MSLSAGLTIADRYVLIREVGRGGMAIVWLARDVRNDRQVALKALLPDLTSGIAMERFFREADVVGRLQHPNILPLFDTGEADGAPFFVMPYVEGETLRQRLDREKQLSLGTALEIAEQVSSALAYAHDRGIVHRDVKPGNVMFMAGQAVVADFGIARAMEEVGDDRLTATGLAVGTPAYMSPEQADGRSVLDGRADQYSLACMVYEMLAGHPPFTAASRASVMARHALDPVPPLRSARANTPDHVERAVVRALEKVPADRWQSTGEFATALRDPTLTEDLPSTAVNAAREPASSRPWNRRARALIAATVVLGAGVAATLMLGGGASEDATGVPPVQVIRPATRMAVMPFVPAVTDSTLENLGRELMVMVSGALNGIGGLRTEDPTTILATGEVARELEEVARRWRRMGVLSFVQSSLVESGGGLRAEVRVYDTDSLTVLREFSVSAPADDKFAAADSLAFAILREVWREGQPMAASIENLGTRSQEAIRRYTLGLEAVTHGRWREAESEFAAAYEADTTFALALLRWYDVCPWADNCGSGRPAPRSRVDDMADRLPPTDRQRLEIWAASENRLELTRAHLAFARANPNDWWTWATLADGFSHGGPNIGYTGTDGTEVWGHIIEMAPAVPLSREHGWDMGIRFDTALAAGADSLFRANDPSFFDGWFGIQRLWGGALPDSTYLPLRQAVLEALRSGGLATPATRDSLVDLFALLPSDSHAQFSLYISLWAVPALQEDLAGRILGRGLTGRSADWQRLSLVQAAATRGAWDRALDYADGLADLSTYASAEYDVYRLAVVGTWLGLFDSEQAIRRRPEEPYAGPWLWQDEGGFEPHGRLELAWLDGLVAYVRRDREALDAAVTTVRDVELDVPEGAPPRDIARATKIDQARTTLERSLRAFAIDLEGRRGEAADSLFTLTWDRAAGTDGSLVEIRIPPHPYLMAVNRLAASRWLLAEGDTVRAEQLLTWVDAWQSLERGRPVDLANWMIAPHAYLERARIAAARGRRDLASEYYRQFLRRYDDPVERHRSLRIEAENAVGVLWH